MVFSSPARGFFFFLFVPLPPRGGVFSFLPPGKGELPPPGGVFFFFSPRGGGLFFFFWGGGVPPPLKFWGPLFFFPPAGKRMFFFCAPKNFFSPPPRPPPLKRGCRATSPSLGDFCVPPSPARKYLCFFLRSVCVKPPGEFPGFGPLCFPRVVFFPLPRRCSFPGFFLGRQSPSF